ncbi:Protein of unknown function [Bacillus cereus]|nr:Protein of unknown function [Bacillus cereus]
MKDKEIHYEPSHPKKDVAAS